MATTGCDRLTGGTFMVLLEQAKKPSAKARESVAGKADGLNNQELLKALIRIFDPGYPDPYKPTFKQNVSVYRSCQMSQGIYLPFDQEVTVQTFDTLVRNNYAAPLERMKKFVDRFINADYHGERLAQMLLGLLKADETIDTNQELFVTPDGKPVTKTQALDAEEIVLEALLLGLWHYIVTYVPDNTVGAGTFERWHKPAATERIQRCLLPDMVPTLDRSIQVLRFDGANEAAEDGDDDSDVAEAEFVDDEEPNSDDSSSDDGFEESVAYTDGRVVVFQGGTNNTNIGHIETLNLNR